MPDASRAICFVSHNVYPVLTSTSLEFMGGAELQQVIIGRHMAKEGYPVSFITGVYDGKRSDESIENIQVLKTFASDDGLPVLRFIYPKSIKLWRALSKSDAEIFYQRCADYTTAIIALFCLLKKKKFIYAASHDTNFIPDKIKVPYLRDKLMYMWGLKRASHVFVQSRQQKELLEKNFGLKGSVVPNVYPKKELAQKQEYVLWVANIKESKRPWILLDLAQALPDIRFVMVGGRVRNEEALSDEIDARAKGLPNLSFLGFRTFEETEKLFQDALAFVNTSELEGFPNTFLQAWARGVPTISFFDPDAVIEKNGLGRTVRSASEMEAAVREVKEWPRSRRERIKSFFDSRFTPEVLLERLEKILQ